MTERDQMEYDVVVVGAGPTGVEMAGQIAELAHRTLKKDFRRINTREARVILLDAAPQVLPPFGKKLGEKTKKDLEGLGVEVQLGAMVVAFFGGDELHVDCEAPRHDGCQHVISLWE